MLKDVKPGDKLALHGGWNGIVMVTVDRVTETMVICGPSRYHKSNGRTVGQTGYQVSAVRIPTSADLLEIRIKKSQRFISNYQVTAESLDLVESFIDLAKTKDSHAERTN